MKPPSMSIVSVFHRVVALAFFVAFLSLHMQWEGLYSVAGLLPAADFVERVRAQATSGSSGIFDILQKFPSLLAVAPELGVGDVEGLAQALMLLGMLVSAHLALQRESGRKKDSFGWLKFLVLWAAYLSLQLVGQTFLSFQWDILLLEVGFLCIFTASAPASSATAWLHRFLAWKLMFLSGCVKLQARCETWEKLTALEFHFATQPLPTPLAWHAHQMSPLLLRIGVLLTLILEIPLTFLLIMPSVNLRRVGAILQIGLQIVIALTGNYTFFNVLTVALMLQVYSDQAASPVDSLNMSMTKAWTLALLAVYFCCSAMLDMEQLHSSLKTGREDLAWSGATMRLKPDLWDSWRETLQSGVVMNVALGVVLLQVALAWNHGIVREVQAWWKQTEGYSKRKSGSDCVLACLKLSLGFMACVVLVPLSATTMSSVAPSSIIPRQVHEVANKLRESHLTIASGYGLFRSMTGVWPGQGSFPKDAEFGVYIPSVVARPEILIQGREGEEGDWKPIEFSYKPGDLDEAPRWVAPLQPRLDWQMWFAALGSYQHNPWLIQLARKLLSPNNQHIWNLLDTAKNADTWRNGDVVPSAVRMRLWDYSFTFEDSAWSQENHPERTKIVDQQSSQWWHRVNEREYMPEISMNENIVKYLENNGLGLREHLSKVEEFAKCMGVQRTYLMHPVHSHLTFGGVSLFWGSWASHAIDGIQQGVCSTIYFKPVMETTMMMVKGAWRKHVLGHGEEL